jgi:DNA-binding transcriptional ArsR family regulator
MPQAKKPAPRPSRPPAAFREPAALRKLSRSLDAAQEALAELSKDAGRDVGQGARDLYKDLRTFLTSARRDTSRLAKALQRDFTQAQKRLGGPGTSIRPARAIAPSRARGAARSGTAARKPARARTPARGATGSARATVLEALAGGQAMTATQIAVATGLARGTVSTTLSRLARAGEITKTARGYQLGRAPVTVDQTIAESNEAEGAGVPGIDAKSGESSSAQ